MTKDIPKPLLKIGEQTLLKNTIQFMIKMGFSKFVVNTHYKAELIHNELKNIKDADITISHEKEKILGTAGGIKKAFHSILKDKDYFVYINPDIIYRPNINLFQMNKNYSGKCLLFLSESSRSEGYTQLSLKDNKVNFDAGDYKFIGLSILRFSIVKDVQLNEYYDLAEIFKKLSLIGELDGQIFPGESIDLGDQKKYNDFLLRI